MTYKLEALSSGSKLTDPNGNDPEQLGTPPRVVIGNYQPTAEKRAIYSVEVPNLQAGSILFAWAKCHGINNHSVNVELLSWITLNVDDEIDPNLSMEQQTLSFVKGLATNVTPSQHYFPMENCGMRAFTEEPDEKTVNYIVSAASSQTSPGYTFRFGENQGGLYVLHFYPDEHALTDQEISDLRALLAA